MSNLLKRNEQGGIERVCHYPDRDGDRVLYNDCHGCTHRTQCNADIFERLAKYEDTGFEPNLIEQLKTAFEYDRRDMADAIREHNLCPVCSNAIHKKGKCVACIDYDEFIPFARVYGIIQKEEN